MPLKKGVTWGSLQQPVGAGTDFSHRRNESFRLSVRETWFYQKPKWVWQCIPQASRYKFSLVGSLKWLCATWIGPTSISNCRNSREQMDVVRKWLAIALRGGSLTLATDWHGKPVATLRFLELSNTLFLVSPRHHWVSRTYFVTTSPLFYKTVFDQELIGCSVVWAWWHHSTTYATY